MTKAADSHRSDGVRPLKTAQGHKGSVCSLFVGSYRWICFIVVLSDEAQRAGFITVTEGVFREIQLGLRACRGEKGGMWDGWMTAVYRAASSPHYSHEKLSFFCQQNGNSMCGDPMFERKTLLKLCWFRIKVQQIIDQYIALYPILEGGTRTPYLLTPWHYLGLSSSSLILGTWISLTTSHT